MYIVHMYMYLAAFHAYESVHVYIQYCTYIHVYILYVYLCSTQAMWVPGSQTELVVVTDTFVKIYDLQVDLISPVYYFVILTGKIKDATVAVSGEVEYTCIQCVYMYMYMYIHVHVQRTRVENGVS